ncbi:MAG: SGNH/GDSL hydrolase family protein, partial [Actinomycetota bacterium]
SGEGNPPYTSDSSTSENECHRSLYAYPFWVETPGSDTPLAAQVQSDEGLSFDFIACSGARTYNVDSAAAGGEPQSGEPATQLDRGAVHSGTDLVTLTLGGDDVEFADVMSFCGFNECLDPEFRPVDGIRFTDWLEAMIASVQPDLEDAFSDIRAAAPRSINVVLGYPQLFPDTLAEQTCGGLNPLGPGPEWEPDEQDYLNARGVELNIAIGAAGQNMGITYLGVVERFADHEVCGAGGEWIHGASISQGQTFHPNELGHEAYADAVRDYLADGTRESVPGSGSMRMLSSEEQEPAELGSIRSATIEPKDSSVIECADMGLVRPGGVVTMSGDGFVPESRVRIRILEKDGKRSLRSVRTRSDQNGTIHQRLRLPRRFRGASLQIQALGSERDGGDLLVWAAVLSGSGCHASDIPEIRS